MLRWKCEARRAVVKFYNEKSIADFIDCVKWDYYLIGRLSSEVWYGYVEFSCSTNLIKLQRKYGMTCEKLKMSRQNILDHVRQVAEDCVEAGELKRLGSDVIRDKWLKAHEDYNKGDLENISEYMLEVLRGRNK